METTSRSTGRQAPEQREANARLYTQVAAGTRPADRKSRTQPSEQQMLLEMEVRLQVTAQTNQVVFGYSGWWSSRVAEASEQPTQQPTGDMMILTIRTSHPAISTRTVRKQSTDFAKRTNSAEISAPETSRRKAAWPTTRRLPRGWPTGCAG